MSDTAIAKIVCFNVAGEEYGLDVSSVLGINPMLEITRLPQAVDFIEGVIRIRDKVIPLMDMRKRFGREGGGYTKKSRIIIIKAKGERLGVIVDGVSGVVGIPLQCIEPPSCALAHADILKGIGKLENRLILLLDSDKILGGEEAEALAEVHKKEGLEKLD